MKLTDSTRTADDLYKAAKRWFVDAFRDAQEVIQLDDPATHMIVGKGNFTYEAFIYVGSAVRHGVMRFSAEIAARNGRYRVRFYDFKHEGSSSYNTTIGRSPPLDLGVIYNDQTFCTHAYNKKGEPDYEPSKHEVRVCTEEVWPQIHAFELRMLSSLKEAMENPAPASSGPGSSDW
ncbi:MAG TPA: DUF4468 domain-containing protein [Flavobacteriales bacterium]|nr:DUF4468 domain-containing protein [Flavobacteriales bacterium]